MNQGTLVNFIPTSYLRVSRVRGIEENAPEHSITFITNRLWRKGTLEKYFDVIIGTRMQELHGRLHFDLDRAQINPHGLPADNAALIGSPPHPGFNIKDTCTVG